MPRVSSVLVNPSAKMAAPDGRGPFRQAPLLGRTR